MDCLFLSTANISFGTSFVITLPAPTKVFFPNFKGATNETLEPIKESFPIIVLCLLTPS